MNEKYYLSIVRKCFCQALKEMMSSKPERIPADGDRSQISGNGPHSENKWNVLSDCRQVS